MHHHCWLSSQYKEDILYNNLVCFQPIQIGPSHSSLKYFLLCWAHCLRGNPVTLQLAGGVLIEQVNSSYAISSFPQSLDCLLVKFRPCVVLTDFPDLPPCYCSQVVRNVWLGFGDVLHRGDLVSILALCAIFCLLVLNSTCYSKNFSALQKKTFPVLWMCRKTFSTTTFPLEMIGFSLRSCWDLTFQKMMYDVFDVVQKACG